MKTTVMREHFKEGLQIVERVTGKNQALPILQNVLVVAENNKMRLAATDLQMGITCEFLASTEQGGSFVLNPRFVSPLLGVIGESHIALEGTPTHVNIMAGSFHSTVNTVAAEDFPIIPSLKNTDTFIEVKADVFCKGLGQVAGMTGQSQARPEIGGVFFVFEKEMLRMVATDSFRLAEKKLVFEKSNVQEHNFILPQKTAKEIVSILGERGGQLKIYSSPSQVVFDYAGSEGTALMHVQVVSRLIDGEYPDYQNVIPKEHKTRAVFAKEEFMAHLKAASVFSGKTSEVVLSADPAKKSISFTAQSPEAGENHSSVPAEVTGEKVAAAFNWRFLLDGLLQMKDSRIELVLNGEEGPALVRAGDQEGYLYVIMPIKA